MNIVCKYLILIVAFLYLPLSLWSTHNRAGEITYEQISALSIRITITTYTKASSTAADRDSLEVFWGDGARQFVNRDNSKTRFEPNDIKINYYIATHTYPGVATYIVSMLDPNRVGGILNVNYPNSIDIPFFLSTSFTLLDPQFQGFNNSAVLLQPPVDFGCVNRLFIHNPNAYDADGDSLAYELTAPLQAVNTPVPGYRSPDEIVASTGNKFTINPITGEVRWDSPKLQGEYNIAIRIKEYRNGKLINVILRDMQIFIKECNNEPPSIQAIDELCVIAGDKIDINIDVNDPNVGQKVKLTATGGPFTFQDPATLVGPKFFTPVKFSAKLEWQTNCNHISDQYYQVVLRAVDNFNPDSTGLATLKTIRIKVVGPDPKNLTAQSQNGDIKLEWENPYECEITDNNYFQGFSVWRKIASSSFAPDTCNPGLTGSPYSKIVFKTLTKDSDKYFYNDTSAESGNTYCYRVQAEFAKLTSSNNPYNRVESLPSNETCLVLLRDVPLITKISVDKTGFNDGEMQIKWTKPLADQLDTLLNPGPYTYQLWRAEKGQTYTKITEFTATYFNSSIDTTFSDQAINTLEKQYQYFVRLLTNGRVYGNSPEATSVFLKSSPSDKLITLSWESMTPWSNQLYILYKKDASGNFNKVAETSSTSYIDQPLINDSIYCYKIESIGTYSIPNIENPIFNFSQEICLQPKDNVPPCPPTITVVNICDQLHNNINPDELYNTVSWTDPKTICPLISNDMVSFNIYYAETINDTLRFLANQLISEPFNNIHYPENGLLGCYAVTAIDALGNESALSNKVCVDNCPFYELPNTFTPNGDGKNDLFKPRVNLFIINVNFKVFNQWGNLIFETNDPNINWDGTTTSGSNLADGTYYYTCRVFENRVTGVTQSNDILKGFIHIIRN